MRAKVNLFAVLYAVAAGTVASGFGASEARAEGTSQIGADRFVPSLVVVSGVEIQGWDGSGSSEICRDCSFPDPTSEALRPAIDSSTFDVTPYVGGQFELMFPEIAIPTSPRFFFSVDVGGAFGLDRRVAREGDPGRIGSPLPPMANTNFDEDGATGQGTALIAVRDRLTYGASAGVAFPFRIWERQLRLRTSVSYMRFGIEAEGRVSNAECTPFQQFSRCNPNSNPGSFLRAFESQVSGDEQFDALGPGLTIELDTGRYGPIGSSIQFGIHALKVLGNRSVDLSTPVIVIDDQLGRDEHRARYQFEVDEWMYRAGVGFRLYWLGYAP